MSDGTGDASGGTPEGPVLVVGGAGYIGSHTVRALEERGVPVVVLDNLSTGHRAAVRSELVVADLADASALADVFERHAPRSVIHFAAKCYVGESVQNPAKYYRENVVATFNLLEAMRAADCRDLVFSSTCATYGNPAEMPMSDEHPQLPVNPYGRTKLHIEHMMEDYGQAYGLRSAALRYFNAAGAHPDGTLGEVHDPETHLIPLLLQAALGRRDEIVIFGNDYPTRDGTCIRDYIHIVDLADAHLRALALLQSGRPTLRCNLGTGRGYTVKEIVGTARQVTGHEIPTRLGPRRPGDPPELVSGGRIAQELLGWRPARAEIATIVGDAWNFLQQHPDGYKT